MERIFKNIYVFKEYITVFLAIVLSSFLLISNENKQIENLREKTIDFTGKIKQNFAWVKIVFNTIDENRELREKVLYLTLENTRIKDAEIENQRLRKMIGFKKSGNLKYLPAVVISKGFHQIINSIQINVGENDGVKKNMPVIAERGLVGKTFLVGKESSLVQMMNDVNFGVSARILRTRATGIVNWKTGNIFEISYVPKSSDVAVGDTIITSGYGQIYPPKIPVGVVSEVSDSVPGMSKKITLKILVDFPSVEEVFVIVSDRKPEFILR